MTICTKDKQHFFGKIINGEMEYSKIGTYTLTQLMEISQHYLYAEIFEMVVMPNHVHFMIEIYDGIPRTHESSDKQSNENQRTHGPCVPTERTTLSVVIGGFKRAVTMFARRNNIFFEWQKRYHDHIIRGIDDFNKIGEYIRYNVGKWDEDCFYQM